jgi:hypothetical protein
VDCPLRASWSSDFLVFAIAGLLGAVMVALVRQKANNTTASGPAERTPVGDSQNA